MKPLSLRTKLTFYYSAVLTLVLTGFAFLILHTSAVFLQRSSNEELEDRASALRGYLRYQDGQLLLAPQSDDPGEAYFIHNAARYFQAYDLADGSLVSQSRDLELLDVAITPGEVGALARDPQLTQITTPVGTIWFHNSIFEVGPNRFLIRVGTSTEPAQTALQGLRRQLLLLIPPGVVLVAFVGWQMARRALKPMQNLAAAARRIDIQQLHERLPLYGAEDEIDQLARTFNDTLARLEDAVGQMKQFTASISHELRTPLTALRGEAEVALLSMRSADDYRRVLASQLEEFDRLTRMINQLLTLARAEAGEIRLTDQTVDLSALARSLVDQMEPIAAMKSISLRVTVTDGVLVRGDEHWLERLTLNLLDNAIKFTKEGGQVELSIAGADSRAILGVRDSGRGISPEDLPHIFDRFYRAEPSRSKEVEGVGLGLALVKWIAERHHGTIEIESSPGRGSYFAVSLPLERRA
jgi:heavy metal sensor kinase